MKIPNPDNPIFVQRNLGDRDAQANIAGSWNCDFSRFPGKVCPSVPLELQLSQEDTAALGPILAVASWDNNQVGDGPYWGVSSGGDVWEGPASGNWSADNNTNSPTTTNESDIVTFNGTLCASESTTENVAMQSTNVWDVDWYTTRSGASALASGPYPMEVLRIGAPVFAMGEENHIHTVTVDGVATHDRLTLDGEFSTTWIRSGTSRVFIGGVMSKQGNRTVVYEWDGGDTVPTRQYQLETRGVLSAIVLDDVLYVLTYEMEIKVLSGGGFILVGQFPVTKERNEIADYDGSGYSGTVTVPRGMSVLGDKILINISSLVEANTALEEKYVPNYPSGVWEFDTVTRSLSHKHAYKASDESDAKDIGQWVAPVANDVHPGVVIPVVDVDGDATLVVSGCYFIDSGTNDYVGFYADYLRTDTPRRARLVTNQVFSPDKTSQWKIALKYAKMKSANDKILVKYRLGADAKYPLRATVTWASTTSFTSTSTDLANAKVGDEVFVVCGYGGGSSAHITAVSVNAGTYTVTLGDTIYGVTATNTGVVAVEDWKLLTSFNDQVEACQDWSIPDHASPSIQVLIELRSAGGDSPILEEIDISPVKSK